MAVTGVRPPRPDGATQVRMTDTVTELRAASEEKSDVVQRAIWPSTGASAPTAP